MEKIIFIVNLLVVLLSCFCVVYSYKIWALTKFKGMFWLFLSLIYASFLRTWVLFDIPILNDAVIYGMIGFWSAFSFALYKLYNQTDKLLTIHEARDERRHYDNWKMLSFALLCAVFTIIGWTVFRTYVWEERPGQLQIIENHAKTMETDCYHYHELVTDEILFHTGNSKVKAFLLHPKTMTYSTVPEYRTEEEIKTLPLRK